MVELVFSDSAEGAIRYAQNWGKGPFRPIHYGFIPEDGSKPSRLKLWCMQRRQARRDKQEWEQAVVLPRSDVFALSLGICMGSIGPDRFWEDRTDLFAEAALTDLPPEDAAKARTDACRRIQKVQHNLEEISGRIKAGEPLRIWGSHTAEDQCMLAWFSAQLEARGLVPAAVYLNQLPEKYRFPDGICVSWNGWGEVEPGKWGLLDRELRREVSEDFLREQAGLWHRLVQENTLLRILENGRLKSTGPDYYDDRIRAEIRQQPEVFSEAQVIGRLIGSGMNMPDIWIAGRIARMIDAGELQIDWEEVPGSHSYRRRLKKIL